MVLSYAQSVDSADLYSLSNDLRHLSVTDYSQELNPSEGNNSTLLTPSSKRKHSRSMISASTIFDDEQPNAG